MGICILNLPLYRGKPVGGFPAGRAKRRVDRRRYHQSCVGKTISRCIFKRHPGSRLQPGNVEEAHGRAECHRAAAPSGEFAAGRRVKAFHPTTDCRQLAQFRGVRGVDRVLAEPAGRPAPGMRIYSAEVEIPDVRKWLDCSGMLGGRYLLTHVRRKVAFEVYRGFARHRWAKFRTLSCALQLLANDQAARRASKSLLRSDLGALSST